MRKRDILLNILTYVYSGIGIVILLLITIYIFSNGLKSLSWDLLTNDYYDKVFSTNSSEEFVNEIAFTDPKIEGSYFSKNFGVSLINDVDTNNNEVVRIVYVDKNSPFNYMEQTNSSKKIKITVDQVISKIILTNENGDYILAISSEKAEEMVKKIDNGTKILDMTSSFTGGGIRGSLIATFYLIILTLIIAMPIGIIASIYLNEYEKKNKLNNILMSMIDLTSGIPSIIFGLVGVVIFIPIVSKITNKNSGSILSGALTLSIMLLPIIIRNTIEALKNVPDSLRNASLALGASKAQTIFKVVLPNAVNGILTSIILSIGKIIGESAALIYAIGTTIKDEIILTDKATSLAVHIWVLMSGDKPNFEVACSVSIIILVMVFLLSFSIKIVSLKFNRVNVK